ncbi:MAG: SWIM zinc finger family protein [Turicibacter sp.]|nr:SWIM zinc finger family protein [Turicibacter sp.]
MFINCTCEWLKIICYHRL